MTSVLGAWINFFSTVAESAATLTGLVIVAVSVNLQKILSYKHLPARAFGAIGALVIVMIMAMLALVPQPLFAYAVELALAAVLGWFMHVRTASLVFKGHAELGRPLSERIALLAFGQAQLVPLTIGAGMLCLGHPTGLYFVAATVVASLIVSVINAWVLLVEILR